MIWIIIRQQDMKIIYVAVNMMMSYRKKISGFTLLEMLLVLAIISSIMIMLLGYVTQKGDELRRDRLTLQTQQLLNIGLTYYVNNGKWPQKGTDPKTPEIIDATHPLVTEGYLPAAPKSPWGKDFLISNDPVTGKFSVETDVTKTVDRDIVAGRLPFATANPADTKLIAAVNIPGQNLNNARSVNFAGIYHPGACVPAPKCPLGMSPDIMVIPVSVSGLNDEGKKNVYPISSFTGYAYGEWSSIYPKTTPVKPTDGAPALCNSPYDQPTPCEAGNEGYVDPITRTIVIPKGTIDNDTAYWRVCLNIITEKGDVNNPNPDDLPPQKKHWEWGGSVSVLAITRCVPKNEPSGSNFKVWKSGD